MQSRDTGGIVGIVNSAFSDAQKSVDKPHILAEAEQQHELNNRARSSSQPRSRTNRLHSTGELSGVGPDRPIRGYSSVDNLLDREMQFEQQFMMKYRQVSGDLLSSTDLVELAKEQSSEATAAWDKSLIESKAVRKEKKKRRGRTSSSERLGYETDTDVRYEPNPPHCYVNRGLEQSPVRSTNLAPLALHEISDLSPVPFNRHTKYNASYRLATNQPATPKLNFPRTSTKVKLQPADNLRKGGKDECVYARAEPYLNSDASSVVGPEGLYSRVGEGPIQRYRAGQVHRHTMPPHQTQHSQPPQLRPHEFRRNNAARTSRTSQATVDSGRYSDYSRTSGQATRSQAGLYARLPAGSGGSQQSRYSRFGMSQAGLKQGGTRSPEDVAEMGIQIFKLLTLIIPPSNRRKLQLLLKFIRKISLNHELRLDPNLSNRALSLSTFTEVILRPADLFKVDSNASSKIVDLFLNRYEEIWTPPESLRKEVEEKVYHSLVDKRIQAGEDPYPVTYCKQMTKAEYEAGKLSGADAALLDLLQAILVDRKMSDKEKVKKLKKFKDSYPAIWKRKFPTESSEPELGTVRKINKFGSLSRIKSVMGM